MSSVTLATASLAFEQRVRRAFGGRLNGELARWSDEIMFIDAHKAVREIAAAHAPAVVAIGPNVDVDAALQLAAEFEASRPETAVIVIAEPTPDLWERALRAGVRDVLLPDADDDEIVRVFQRAIETSERRRSNLVQAVTKPAPTGKVLTVVAPKGGSGKTTFATNLAVALSHTQTGRVALVDLDLQFGDVAHALRLRPENTIADLLAAPAAMSDTALKVFLTPRGEDLFVLCAPDDPAAGETITDAQVESIIESLAVDFEYVVVDTAAGLTEPTLAAIELSTDLVFVCDLSVSAVKGLRKVIEALDQLEIGDPKRHFVLNRADSKVGVDATDAAEVVGMRPSIELPSSRSVPLSMNQGIPVVEAEPRSLVARRLLDAALLFLEEGAEHDRGGFLKRRSRR